MESFDLKIAGVNAVLYIDGMSLRIEEEDKVLLSTDNVLSVSVKGTERLMLAWQSDEGRHIITVRVTSAPAAQALDAITSEAKK